MTTTTPSSSSSTTKKSSSSTTNGRNTNILSFIKTVSEDYRDVFGRSMPRLIGKTIIEQMELHGAETVAKWYEYALMETLRAPRPSWRYTEAIISRLISGGKPNKRTAVDQGGTKTVTEQRYQQREYTDDDDTIPDWLLQYLNQPE